MILLLWFNRNDAVIMRYSISITVSLDFSTRLQLSSQVQHKLYNRKK